MIVISPSIYALLFKYPAGLPGLDSFDEDGLSGSTQGPEAQQDSDPIPMNKMMVQQAR